MKGYLISNYFLLHSMVHWFCVVGSRKVFNNWIINGFDDMYQQVSFHPLFKISNCGYLNLENWFKFFIVGLQEYGIITDFGNPSDPNIISTISSRSLLNNWSFLSDFFKCCLLSVLNITNRWSLENCTELLLSRFILYQTHK